MDESLRPAHPYLQMFKDDVNVFPPPGIIASCTAGTSLKQLKMADICKTVAYAFLPTKRFGRVNPFYWIKSVNEQIQQIRK
jgi:hypothetical protein